MGMVGDDAGDDAGDSVPWLPAAPAHRGRLLVAQRVLQPRPRPPTAEMCVSSGSLSKMPTAAKRRKPKTFLLLRFPAVPGA